MLSMESVQARLAEAALSKDQSIDGLKVEWTVFFIPLDHDLRITYDLRADDPDIAILQVWATNLRTDPVGIPNVPQITNIVEFDPSAQARAFKGALFDGKWRREDKGQRYRAIVAGYCRVGDGLADFFYSRDYVFPGW